MSTLAAPVHETAFTTEHHPYTLFFDGECAFCDRWVNRIRAADHAGLMRFGAKQGRTFQEFARVHPEFADVESVVLVRRNPAGGDDVLLRSRAVRGLVGFLPRFRLLALLLAVVPTFLADIGYRIFAKLRLRLFGRLAQCRIPGPGERELFLD